MNKLPDRIYYNKEWYRLTKDRMNLSFDLVISYENKLTNKKELFFGEFIYNNLKALTTDPEFNEKFNKTIFNK